MSVEGLSYPLLEGRDSGIDMKNQNAFQELMLKITALGNLEGKVGWFEKYKYPVTGIPVAQVAAMQEFGTSTIPARPFMRPAAIKNQQKWQETIAKVSKKVTIGAISPENAMQLITSQAEGDVLQSIKDVDSPPLSKITIGIRKYKQMGKAITGKTIGEIASKIKDGTLDLGGVSTKPLNDTGYMIATLTTHIDKK